MLCLAALLLLHLSQEHALCAGSVYVQKYEIVAHLTFIILGHHDIPISPSSLISYHKELQNYMFTVTCIVIDDDEVSLLN